MQYTDIIASPVGNLTVSSDGEHLCGLWLEGQKYHAITVDESACPQVDLPIFAETRAWLDRYFRGEQPGLIPPVKPQGTVFRQRIWKLLCEIPYGELTTYGELAHKIAVQEGKERSSARAVGGAVGHNPISIIIPCHRVVGSGNSLTGYAGGLERKLALLELEGVDVHALKIPPKGTAL